MAKSQLRSITDIFKSVFIVAQPHGDGYRVLLFSAAPTLQVLPMLTEDELPDGVHSFWWHRNELLSTVACLRDLGFFVSVYSSDSLNTWLAPIEEAFVIGSDDAPDFPAIVDWLPDCRTYVEVFGGCSSALFYRTPAAVEVVNDHFGVILNLFRQLRDPKSFSSIFLLSRLYPLELRYDAHTLLRSALRQFGDDATRCAYVWCRYLHEFAYPEVKQDTQASVPSGVVPGVLAAMRSIDSALVQAHTRLYRVQLEQNTLELVLKLNDSDSTLFWLAPPDDGDPGSLSLDETEVFFSQLRGLRGRTVLYLHDDHTHEHFRSLLNDAGLVKALGWTSKRFGKAVVYRTK